jgi:hypothetical protein
MSVLLMSMDQHIDDVGRCCDRQKMAMCDSAIHCVYVLYSTLYVYSYGQYSMAFENAKVFWHQSYV